MRSSDFGKSNPEQSNEQSHQPKGGDFTRLQMKIDMRNSIKAADTSKRVYASNENDKESSEQYIIKSEKELKPKLKEKNKKFALNSDKQAQGQALKDDSHSSSPNPQRSLAKLEHILRTIIESEKVESSSQNRTEDAKNP